MIRKWLVTLAPCLSLAGSGIACAAQEDEEVVPVKILAARPIEEGQPADPEPTEEAPVPANPEPTGVPDSDVPKDLDPEIVSFEGDLQEFIDPIANDPSTGLARVTQERPFYGERVPFTAAIPVPQAISTNVHGIRFEKRIFKVGRCEYRVCVPVEETVVSDTQVELRPLDVKLEACVRRDTGTVDVYVLDVAGMPPRWALMLDRTKEEVEARFAIELNP